MGNRTFKNFNILDKNQLKKGTDEYPESFTTGDIEHSATSEHPDGVFTLVSVGDLRGSLSLHPHIAIDNTN